MEPVVDGEELILAGTNDGTDKADIKSPDHDIEQFWLAFKKSMQNFYDAKHVISRPIELWSATLNKLQSQHKYNEIESHIRNYLSLYGIDLLRFESQYHINILITNLKRWDKLAQQYKFFAGEKNLVIILLEIAYSLLKKNNNIHGLFVDVELYLLYEDFTTLLEYAITNNTACIIDKLMMYDAMNVLHKINDLYGTCIEYKIASLLSGKKLIKTVKETINPGSTAEQLDTI